MLISLSGIVFLILKYSFSKDDLFVKSWHNMHFLVYRTERDCVILFGIRTTVRFDLLKEGKSNLCTKIPETHYEMHCVYKSGFIIVIDLQIWLLKPSILNLRWGCRQCMKSICGICGAQITFYFCKL